MLEAMAAGVPVISTSVSGAADALEGEPPAGIVTGFDGAEIAAAINRLRAHPEIRMQLAENARARADTEFSMERMLDRWEEFLAA
jgi:glycosyltransferase involved in cell wall biosynthesis